MRIITNANLAAFILGALSTFLLPELPTRDVLLFIIVTASALLLVSKTRLMAVCLFGIAWFASVGHWALHWQLPQDKINKVVTFDGYVTSAQNYQHYGLYVVAFDRLDSERLLLSPLVRLIGPAAESNISPGSKISGSAILQRPKSVENKGGFSRVLWMMSQGVNGVGHIQSDFPLVISEREAPYRYQLSESSWVNGLENGRLIMALGWGDRSKLTPSDWTVLQETGTAHLLAISGMHLGLVAAIILPLSAVFLWIAVKAANVRMQIAIQPLAIIITLIACTLYAMLSGFASPVVRALYALLIYFLLVLGNRSWRPSTLFLVVVTMLILVAPMRFFSLSLWLSLIAVIGVIIAMWFWASLGVFTSALTKWTRAVISLAFLQLMLLVWLMPISVNEFGETPVVGLLVNLIALPYVGFVLLPLTLICVVTFGVFAHVPVWLADATDSCFTILVMFLNEAADSAFSISNMTLMSAIELYFGVAGILLFVLIKGPVRWFVLGMGLLPSFTHLLSPKAPHWQVHAVDVGQGLAVVIQVNDDAVLYDTGASFDNGSMAKAAIIPLLPKLGVKNLRRIYISHGDDDHAGGLADMLLAFPDTEVVTSPEDCNTSHNRQFYGLRLRVLWPSGSSLLLDDVGKSSNDTSCVIEVSDGKRRVLLPGDISKEVEWRLLKSGKLRPTNILFSPHHGSNSSSSYAFIQAVAPQHVVHSQGHRHRWGFPHDEVVKRYRDLNVTQWKTSESGQITISIPYNQELPIEIQTFRHHMRPFWYYAQRE